MDLYGADSYVIAARLGFKEVTRTYLQRLLKARSEKWIPPTILFSIYFSLGENENGLQSLYQAAKENDPGLHIISVFPLWDDYTSTPSVNAVLSKWQTDTNLP